jgi:Flp pilus assembly pilin Flp
VPRGARFAAKNRPSGRQLPGEIVWEQAISRFLGKKADRAGQSGRFASYSRMTELPRHPAQGEGRATAIEYALIAALIALVVIAAVRGVGTDASAPNIILSGSLG